VKAKEVKLSSLVLDYTIYPRQAVDDCHVRRLCDHLEAGIKLPPIIIDKRTKKVIDGFHRVKAHLRHFGKEGTILVIEIAFATDREMFLEAVARNVPHGLVLSPSDRQRIMDMAVDLKIEREKICATLHITVKRIDALSIDRRAANGQQLKRSIRHMAGKSLTPRQHAANKKLTGQRQDFIINQVIELLEAELINRDDQAVVGALERLARALEQFLGLKV